MNCYQEQIDRVLPRILSMYDIDKTSSSYGCGDRFYWGWKLIDFPNGTYQAIASAIAGLFANGYLPDYLSEHKAYELIDAVFIGTENLVSTKGSLDEAFPNEASFCVTGLVAGDLLLAIERLDNEIDEMTRKRWLEIVKPMIDFLKIQDEYHGVISNHLATNALALVRWSDLTGNDVDHRAKEWVDRILENQSEEGWFSEYGGPDPGYQTWCTSSLAAIHKLRPQWRLLEPLVRSVEFLSYAAHPDGSFGGIYGSRMTRFIFPAGLELLSEEVPKAKMMADFSRNSINRKSCVTLETIDPSNCIPVFNDYVTALIEYDKETSSSEKNMQIDCLPCQGEDFCKVFERSGWYVLKKEGSYTVLNLNCGGAGIHIDSANRHQQISGYVGRNDSEQILTSQKFDESAHWVIDGEKIRLKSSLYRVNRPKPDAFRFIVLRVLSLTAFRSLYLGNVVKKLLVKMLVTGKSKKMGHVEREMIVGESIKVTDRSSLQLVDITDASFKPVHMASMGYWQLSDTAFTESKK